MTMVLDRFREASEEWIGELVRYHWGVPSKASGDVGVVVGVSVSCPDGLEPNIRHKRLVVWWPVLGRLDDCPSYHLTPLGLQDGV
jgi:hypothetical protein